MGAAVTGNNGRISGGGGGGGGSQNEFGEYLADQMPEWSFQRLRVAYLAADVPGPVTPPLFVQDRAARMYVSAPRRGALNLGRSTGGSRFLYIF